jgi:sigma-B regulation protein RsbU (phosphoserine phosphatase)
MIRVTSLRHRFTLFILIPVTLLLVTMGFAGFNFARDHLLTQWGEATSLKLQRAAHHIDMRLKRPKEMLDLFNRTAGLPHARHIQILILSQLKTLEGVTSVELRWSDGASGDGALHSDRRSVTRHNKGNTSTGPSPAFRMRPFHHGSRVVVEPPRYDTPAGSETVMLLSDLIDTKGKTVGQIRAKMQFEALVDTVAASGWWQDQKAFLVNTDGKILAGNTEHARKTFGDTDDPLERSTLYAMKNMPFGTVFGKGFPPSEVSGFYTLTEAPWTLVIITPGKDILSPIVHFRLYYLGIGAVFIAAILLLIRFVTGGVVASIQDVSKAAKTVAQGDYHVELPAGSKDEIGELMQSFNTMVHQLEERVRMKDSLDLAREVQQNLLPRNSVSDAGLEIAGKSLYCDETGGDYYDFIHYPDANRICIAVGDVSGHGIAAALLMATVRAMIRYNEKGAENPGGLISSINRLLCEDTAETGDFMTLFYLLYDASNAEMQWVRAGHDPAILYDPERDSFAELDGRGLALGVDKNWIYSTYKRSQIRYGQIVLIGTDGIWEAENDKGERFGKDRLKRVIRRHSYACADKIKNSIVDALIKFRNGKNQEDDITLVVIKAVS